MLYNIFCHRSRDPVQPSAVWNGISLASVQHSRSIPLHGKCRGLPIVTVIGFLLAGFLRSVTASSISSAIAEIGSAWRAFFTGAPLTVMYIASPKVSNYNKKFLKGIHFFNIKMNLSSIFIRFTYFILRRYLNGIPNASDNVLHCQQSFPSSLFPVRKRVLIWNHSYKN